MTLQGNAVVWGRQLLSAGVNMNLAPVADTVPPDLVTVNAPIGKFDREYGNDPTTVAVHSTAFMRGMRQAGVDPTIKHFPGLGRVIGNTDVTANVVDGVTTATDPYLQPFRSGIQAGTPFVMVSSAIYSRIDPRNQAAFSSAVIRGMLRGSLGFRGVVISDDLGQAAAVADRTPAPARRRLLHRGRQPPAHRPAGRHRPDDQRGHQHAPQERGSALRGRRQPAARPDGEAERGHPDLRIAACRDAGGYAGPARRSGSGGGAVQGRVEVAARVKAGVKGDAVVVWARATWSGGRSVTGR